MDIGDRLKIVRKEHLGMSQAAFAEHMGVSRDTLNNLERNRLKNPGHYEPLFRLICRDYNISYEWLMDGTGEMITMTHDEELAAFAAEVIQTEDHAFKKRLIRALSQLTEDQWDMIEAIVDKINKQE